MNNIQYESMRNIKRSAERFIKNYKDFVAKSYNDANTKLYNEAVNMYNSYIEQFYETHETKMYDRHGEGIGTGTGWNLYNAQDFSIYNENVLSYSILNFNLSTDPNKLAPYKSNSLKKRITKKMIFENVINGIRGIEGLWSIPWEASYEGTYFSSNGTIAEAFDKFEEEYDNLLVKICGNSIDEKFNKLSERFLEVFDRNIYNCYMF